MHLSLIVLLRKVRTMNRSYTELIALPTFEERFKYLLMHGVIAEQTFAGQRWLNQVFYRSPEWRTCRRNIIVRDNGCDLACPDHEILGELVVVHHLNPITIDDVKNRSSKLFDPENLITIADSTHKAITYGDESFLLRGKLIERFPNDTCPWR